VKHVKVSAVKNKYYIKNTAAAGVGSHVFWYVKASVSKDFPASSQKPCTFFILP